MSLENIKSSFLDMCCTYVHSPFKGKGESYSRGPGTEQCNKELQAFLGLLNYYGKFISQQSTTLAPLYCLLRRQTTWKWSAAEQTVFVKCKVFLTSDKMLAHYDSSLPLTLACDASAYGIGAVIQHTMLNGEEQPISYASQTLSLGERKKVLTD